MSIRNYVSNARKQAIKKPVCIAEVGETAPQPQPYIISISNASTNAVSNFDILGANTYINSTGFVNGSLTLNGVTISSAISNMNYQQFLYQSMNQPFSVGLTYIERVSGSSSQISQRFTLNTRDENGIKTIRTIVPTIDPFQQSIFVAVKQLYSIDEFTKITFDTIQASVVFRLHFYPSTIINLASALSGQAVAQSYKPNSSGVLRVVKYK
jgi:hypothetical protein